MHIPDGVLSPQVAVATGLVGAAGLRVALGRLRCRDDADRSTVLMGVVSAFVFAAQMVNFPVGPGVSGHLLGGVLSAVVLGPWAGATVIASVLIVQCLLFGDGGLTALGANFVNMGLIGAIGGYAIYAPIRRAIGGKSGVLIGAMAAAWFSVVLCAGAFAVELAASGRLADFPRILGWMALVHAAIGLGEAIITGVVLRFVLQVRPDLIDEPTVAPVDSRRGTRELAAAGLGIALAVAVFLGPLASEWPDGLEFVGERLNFLGESPPALRAPIADYSVPGLGRSIIVATALAGLIGTLAVFAFGLVLSRPFAKARKAPWTSDAA
jgi:cobalt/nickel transport system permease protein